MYGIRNFHRKGQYLFDSLQFVKSKRIHFNFSCITIIQYSVHSRSQLCRKNLNLNHRHYSILEQLIFISNNLLPTTESL
jgi:hypothetical protein